jgi:hypothetical protein
MEEEKQLELRMYFFVPYNISPIQQAIQAGHSALEYADKYGSDEEYIIFVREWKTWIILDGGTTNDGRDFTGIAQGILNQIGDQLLENDIKFAYFQEPDLNDALTALCFICDERVFNKKDYPDFVNYFIDNYRSSAPASEIVGIRMLSNEALIEYTPDRYKEWVRLVGGVKNVFLRELLKDKKLAR